MRTALLVLAVGFVACDGGDTDTETEGTGSETAEEITERKFAELVTISAAPVADDGACWAPGDDFRTQDVDSALQVAEERTIIASTFSGGNPVGGATISIWDGDDLTESPDTTIVTSTEGNTEGEAVVTTNSCMPVGLRVTADGAETTYESHQVFGPSVGGDPDSITTVQSATFGLITSVLGVSVDDDKSVIAGTVTDCSGDGISNVQIVIRGTDGNIPDSLIVNYVDTAGASPLPSRTQEATDAGGVWVAINIPEGDWVAEAYVSDGAEGHDLVGTSTITNFEGTVGIGNIYWGIEGGVAYPDSCLTVATEEAEETEETEETAE